MRTRQDIADGYRTWKNNGSYLKGGPLERAVEAVKKHPEELPPAHVAFVRKSQRRKWGVRAVGVIVVAAIVGFAGATMHANDKLREAQARTLDAGDTFLIDAMRFVNETPGVRQQRLTGWLEKTRAFFDQIVREGEFEAARMEISKAKLAVAEAEIQYDNAGYSAELPTLEASRQGLEATREALEARAHAGKFDKKYELILADVYRMLIPILDALKRYDSAIAKGEKALERLDKVSGALDVAVAKAHILRQLSRTYGRMQPKPNHVLAIEKGQQCLSLLATVPDDTPGYDVAGMHCNVSVYYSKQQASSDKDDSFNLYARRAYEMFEKLLGRGAAKHEIDTGIVAIANLAFAILETALREQGEKGNELANEAFNYAQKAREVFDQNFGSEGIRDNDGIKLVNDRLKWLSGFTLEQVGFTQYVLSLKTTGEQAISLQKKSLLNLESSVAQFVEIDGKRLLPGGRKRVHNILSKINIGSNEILAKYKEWFGRKNRKEMDEIILFVKERKISSWSQQVRLRQWEELHAAEKGINPNCPGCVPVLLKNLLETRMGTPDGKVGKRDVADIIEWSKKALADQPPDSPSAVRGRMAWFWTMNLVPEIYERLAKDPDSASQEAGKDEAQIGFWEEARNQLEEFIAAFPQAWLIRNRLGEVQRILAEKHWAAGHIERASSLYIGAAALGDPEATATLAEAYKTGGLGLTRDPAREKEFKDRLSRRNWKYFIYSHPMRFRWRDGPTEDTYNVFIRDPQDFDHDVVQDILRQLRDIEGVELSADFIENLRKAQDFSAKNGISFTEVLSDQVARKMGVTLARPQHGEYAARFLRYALASGEGERVASLLEAWRDQVIEKPNLVVSMLGERPLELPDLEQAARSAIALEYLAQSDIPKNMPHAATTLAAAAEILFERGRFELAGMLGGNLRRSGGLDIEMQARMSLLYGHWMRIDQPVEAEAAFAEVLVYEPENDDAFLALTGSWIDRGARSEAASAYLDAKEKALAAEISDLEKKLKQAKAPADRERAAEDLKESVQVLARVRSNLAWAQVQDGDVAEGLRQLLDQEKILQDKAEIVARIAEAYRRLGHSSVARKKFEEAKLAPRSPPYLSRFIWQYGALLPH